MGFQTRPYGMGAHGVVKTNWYDIILPSHDPQAEGSSDMLERFKVPKEDEVRVPEPSLRETVTAIFEKMGVPSDQAATGSDTLVMSDLRGVETHGVSNGLRRYVAQYNDGTLNPRPNWRIIREGPGTATIDGDGGLGVILGPKFMEIAMEKAAAVGTGMVSAHNIGHTGAIGHFALQATEADMLGRVTTGGASGGTLPPFGAEPRLGTNPFAFAAPADEEPPLLFDAATTPIAGNKVRLAQRVGATMLPGWIADLDGNPIMEETPVPELGEFYFLPLGGTREMGAHKGFGFSLLTVVLGPMLAGIDATQASGHSFTAHNVAAFTDVDTFKSNMDKMLRSLRDTKPAEGHERVFYPGLPEHEEEIDRRANGIPLHQEVVDWFADICGELSLPSLRTA